MRNILSVITIVYLTACGGGGGNSENNESNNAGKIRDCNPAYNQYTSIAEMPFYVDFRTNGEGPLVHYNIGCGDWIKIDISSTGNSFTWGTNADWINNLDFPYIRNSWHFGNPGIEVAHSTYGDYAVFITKVEKGDNTTGALSIRWRNFDLPSNSFSLDKIEFSYGGDDLGTWFNAKYDRRTPEILSIKMMNDHNEQLYKFDSTKIITVKERILNIGYDNGKWGFGPLREGD